MPRVLHPAALLIPTLASMAPASPVSAGNTTLRDPAGNLERRQVDALGRIVRVCSAPGELVFDPFSGSATTVAVVLGYALHTSLAQQAFDATFAATLLQLFAVIEMTT